MTRESINTNRLILISTFLWGILAHGTMLFNKISFHDDAGLFYVGGTYSLGRWMLGVLRTVSETFFGSSTSSMPLFNGALTILFVAGCTMLLADLFEVRNRGLIVGFSGLMVVFPVITSAMGFMFTAPFYLCGTLLGVLGAWLSCRSRKWYGYAGGLLLMGCAVGVYQANAPVCVSIILLYALKETSEKDSEQWKRFFWLAGKSIFSCVGFMAAYFGCNKLALRLSGERLSDYQGINSMGEAGLSVYLSRIRTAYAEFFSPVDDSAADMYPFSTEIVYQIFLALGIAASLWLLYRCFKRGKLLCLQALVFLLLIPLGVNFIYVICEPGQVDSLMVYGETMTFLYVVWIMDRWMPERLELARIRRSAGGFVAAGSLVVLMALNVMYCRYDNLCYLKAEYMQSQAISYFTALAAQIKSTEGYTQNTPVVYIHEYEKYDYTMTVVPEFNEIKLVPYGGSNLLNDYAWKVTMKMWCGFDPVLGNAEDYQELPEVVQMPTYPDEGSIKMVDGAVIVNF